MFQLRFWIRITLLIGLIGLIALATPRVPRCCNRSFSQFALMELTSVSGEHVWGMMRVSCSTKHWGWDVWYKLKNIFDWYNEIILLIARLHSEQGRVGAQKLKVSAVLYNGILKNKATTECRMILSDIKATQWENVASPWSFLPTIKVKSLSLLSDSGSWLLCFRRRQQNTPPHYWCHNRVKEAIKIKSSQASRMNA